MAKGIMTGGWLCKSCKVVKTYRRDKTCIQCRPSTYRGANLRKVSLVRVHAKTSLGKLEKPGLAWQIVQPKLAKQISVQTPVKTAVKLEETTAVKQEETISVSTPVKTAVKLEQMTAVKLEEIDGASQSTEASTVRLSPGCSPSSSTESVHPVSHEGLMSELVRRELLDAVRGEWNNLIDCMDEMRAHSVMAQCFALATAYNGPSPMPEGMAVPRECVTALLAYGIAVSSCITDPEDYEEVLLKVKQLKPKAVLPWKCFWVNAMNNVDGPVLAP